MRPPIFLALIAALARTMSGGSHTPVEDWRQHEHDQPKFSKSSPSSSNSRARHARPTVAVAVRRALQGRRRSPGRHSGKRRIRRTPVDLWRMRADIRPRPIRTFGRSRERNLRPRPNRHPSGRPNMSAGCNPRSTARSAARSRSMESCPAAVRRAIRDFQREIRLPVSGFIGPDTEAALRRVAARRKRRAGARMEVRIVRRRL